MKSKKKTTGNGAPQTPWQCKCSAAYFQSKCYQPIKTNSGHLLDPSDLKIWFYIYMENLEVGPGSGQTTKLGTFLTPHLLQVYRRSGNIPEMASSLETQGILDQHQRVTIVENTPDEFLQRTKLYDIVIQKDAIRPLFKAWRISGNLNIVQYLRDRLDPEPDVVERTMTVDGRQILSHQSVKKSNWRDSLPRAALVMAIIIFLIGGFCGLHIFLQSFSVQKDSRGNAEEAKEICPGSTTQVPPVDITESPNTMNPKKNVTVSPPDPLLSTAGDTRRHHDNNEMSSASSSGVSHILVQSVSDILNANLTLIHTVNIEVTQEAILNVTAPLVHWSTYHLRTVPGVKTLNILGHITPDWLLCLVTVFSNVSRLYIDASDLSNSSSNNFDEKNSPTTTTTQNRKDSIDLSEVTVFSIHECKDSPTYSFILGLTLPNLREVNICQCDLLAGTRIKDEIYQFLNRNIKHMSTISMCWISGPCPACVDLEVKPGVLKEYQRTLDAPCFFDEDIVI